MSEEQNKEPEAAEKRSVSIWTRVRRVAIRWGLILTGLYFLMAVLLYFFQAKLLFHPVRELVADPGDTGMAYEDVEFTTADGVKLHAWWVPARTRSRGTVIFCHGNAGNISYRTDSIRIFRDLNMDTLIFDYRGYGKSAGSPSEAGFYRDAEAAWEYVTRRRGVSPERILIFGRSLGGPVAAHLAAKHAPRALILESTFSSAPDMGKQLYPWMPRFLARFDFDTAEYVKGVNCPLLSVHSPQDDIVPYALGKKVYAAAPGEKSFLDITGDHNNGFMLSRKIYLAGLANFLGKHFDTTRQGEAHRPKTDSKAPVTGQKRGYRVVHLFVPLCDNKHQGIVKVSAALGNGQSPRDNLYWGAMYGAKTFFKKSAHWKKLDGVSAPTKKHILERVAFRYGAKTPVYLVADAYDGANMKEALTDFLNAAAGRGTEEITAGKLQLSAGGASDLVAFTGHNGLMDVRLDVFPSRKGRAGPECAVILACKSRDYFTAPLKSAGCRALLTTTGFMAPEAYTLDAVLRSWAAGDRAETTRRKAGEAYAKYQKCSRSGALRLFATAGDR
jgi:uncharacterized protein